jgi:phosphopantetheine adenylyltransferase
MTLGEYRVGITFNPSGDGHVNDLKKAAAHFIDLCAVVRMDCQQKSKSAEHEAEIERLIMLAMDHCEDAAMWAVKAATKGPL